MTNSLLSYWKSIPKDIRLISWSTAIRWLGWGMFEPLSAIYLFSLLKNYGQAGFIDSLAGIVFFLIVPFAGILADRISLKKYLIIGLLFFFSSILLSISAVTQMAIFVVIANVFCGIALASDVVGRATYVRRHVEQERIATVMGFQNTFLFFGTIAGCVITFFIVPYVSFPWIFFWVVPTNLITLSIFSIYLKPDEPLKKEELAHTGYSFSEYRRVWNDASRKGSGLRLLGLLTLFFYALLAFCQVLIPIYAYTEGADLQQVILLYILAIVPQIFSSPLGKIADKWKSRLLPIGLVALSVGIVLLVFIKYYFFILGVVFLLQVVSVLLGLVIENLVTERVESTHYGRVSSVFEGLKEAGKFCGAIGLGFAMDFFGHYWVFGGLAVIGFLASMVSRKNIEKDPDIRGRNL